MTAKEYLQQAYRLDQEINSYIEEYNRLRGITESVSSLVLGDRVQTSQSEDALFVKNLEKLMKLEEEIDGKLSQYTNLKEQIRHVISNVSDTDERMVLRYRYIHNYTWEKISEMLHADSRTVRRWHDKALSHVVMPENPICIQNT